MDTEVNGLKVKSFGDPGNKSILFVHGFPYDASMWDYQIEILQENYYCITYDIRGLGESKVGDGQYTMESYVDDLFEVIDYFKIEKPVLCGLSMGGYISLRAVEKDQHRFSSLILCDTKADADDDKGKLKRADAIKQINNFGAADFVKGFIPNTFAESTMESNEKLVNLTIEKSQNFEAGGVKGALLAMVSRTDTNEFLANLELPTLVLAGEEDNLTPPEVMKNMSAKIKNSEFHKVPDSGHMAPLENPKFVNEKISEFISRNIK